VGATTVANVRLRCIASAVPGASQTVGMGSSFSAEEISKVSASTGVMRRYIASENVCTSDLCQASAERLLDEIGWTKESIDVLIFVTQTPDFVLPATACALHGRLGLATGCAAFDVNLGCSGYVYGLWLAANLINGGAKRILLLAGDTISKLVSPEDRSTALLFGDAGTATALEFEEGAPPMYFEVGTNGAGWDHLIVPAGGFRKPHDGATATKAACEGGNIRSQENLFMNGPEIFAFTMSAVPSACKAVMEHAGWQPLDVDAFVMHQANRFMLQHLSKQMRLPKEKVVLGLEEYGNTSCASIPLAMTTELGESLAAGFRKLLLAGFGVGLSWAAIAFESSHVAMPPLIIVDNR
jgi:3-oxoacyl-[acyl-carrier-protein] synthase-3